MKIFSAPQIRALDAFTIAHEPISSVDLMERAATGLTRWLQKRFSAETPFFIFCGSGNNGGDGLVVARLLFQAGYDVFAFHLPVGSPSEDFKVNQERLAPFMKLQVLESLSGFPEIPPGAVILDALFGSGLNRSLEGKAAGLVNYLNQQKGIKIAVDIASGLFADQSNHTTDVIFQPDFTLTFQMPKLAFLLPQNDAFVGNWQVIDIGLHPDFITSKETAFYFTDSGKIRRILKKRGKFSHKGSFGHVLIMGGSYGKIGAVLLAAKAALRSGTGLVTAYVPKCGYQIIQSALPEAMCLTDPDEAYLTTAPEIERYSYVAVGPGLDTVSQAEEALTTLLEHSSKPLVIDADAINLIAQHPELLQKVPESSIFTPHPKEFERLVGKSADQFERLKMVRDFCRTYKVVVVLKGAHSAIGFPNGEVHFNSTGNPGMATAGSGDVLTGVIVSFLSQGYSSEEAAILGAYFHGLAGDFAAEAISQPSLIASDISNYLGRAFDVIAKDE